MTLGEHCADRDGSSQTVHSTKRGRVVIVGGGQAAGRAAEALREAGFGGTVQIISNESYPPYERPPLSKDLLIGECQPDKAFVRPKEYYATAGIELSLGLNVVAIDRGNQTCTTSDGKLFDYDFLLIATGARPRVLAAAGAGVRVHYLRTIEDCLAISPKLTPTANIVIVGAGFIGLEVAAAAKSRGCGVTIIEKAKVPLARCMAPEVGSYFTALHQRHGVSFLWEESVTQVIEGNSDVEIKTESGQVLRADILVVGVGIIPNDELARQAGLVVNDGIVVDENARTTDPKIYAAGDVTRHFNPLLSRNLRLESWQNAQNQARVAAFNIVGRDAVHAEVPFFWTDQYDVRFQSFGVPVAWDRLVWRGDITSPKFSVYYLQEDRVVGAHAVNSPRDSRIIRQLVASGEKVDLIALQDDKIALSDLIARK